MRYRFVKPTKYGDTNRLRTALVAQLQLVGECGSLYETIDFLFVGFLTARFATKLQRFSERLGCPLDFVVKTGFVTGMASRSCTATESPSIVAAIIQDKHAKGAPSQSRLSVWPQGIVITVSPIGSSGYEISKTAQKIARWESRSTATGIVFELKLPKPTSVVALLDRVGLRLVDDERSSDIRLCWQDGRYENKGDAGQQQYGDSWRYMVLVTGIWVAYKEGWLSGKS
ncbi:hypothetical protein N0V90_005952 [Kalmusia sp. IMI 367209]|nr:hypothetical protein N0V90_005952 [Kalmusia sp. IMI 367209]